MMPCSFGGYGAFVSFVIVRVIMVIGSLWRMYVLIIMRMRHSFAHAAMGQHETEDQNHAKRTQHAVTLAER